MRKESFINWSVSTMRAARIVLALPLFLLSSQAFGQQTYVGRYNVYVGYAHLDSPALSLNSNGVHVQPAIRWRSWLSLGFDFSDFTGSGSLTPSVLTTSLQQALGAQLQQLAAVGAIPSGYTLKVPFNATTQTFEAGPDFVYRGFTAVSLFIRPALGAVRQSATPRPKDPIATAIVQQLTPTGSKTDWQYFYGFGGGASFNVTHNASATVQVDVVHDHLFNDLLQNGRWSVRISVGPSFQWGRNMMK
jgi:hypothetical protein